MVPTDTDGNASDADNDLGVSSATAGVDLYLSGGVVVDENPTIVGTTVVNNGTITSKTLDDYEEGTWIPAIAGWTATFVGTYTQPGRYSVLSSYLLALYQDAVLILLEITGLPSDPSASQVTQCNSTSGSACERSMHTEQQMELAIQWVAA